MRAKGGTNFARNPELFLSKHKFVTGFPISKWEDTGLTKRETAGWNALIDLVISIAISNGLSIWLSEIHILTPRLMCLEQPRLKLPE